MISRIKIQNGHKKAEKSQNAFCDFCAFLWRIPSSGNNIGHGSRANRSSAFPDRESQSFLQRHRRDQLNRQVHVVARHDHLHPFGQICRPGHIRRPKIKLRPVSLKERRVPSPFFLRQHIHFRLELRVRRDRCPLGHHLSPLDFFLLGPPQQQSHVVAGLPFIQEFLEHLHARDHRLERRPESHDLHLLAYLHHTPLDPSRHHRPPARYRKYILDRHQKRLVDRPLRYRYVVIHRLHQLIDLLHPCRIIFHPLQRRSPYHRYLIPRKSIALQQIPHFQLHQIQQLRIFHRVALVQKHHDVGHPHLPRQQNVLSRLRHRPVRRRHHQYRPIHLRRPRDHVLDVVGVSRTIHMRIVPLGRLVLHVCRRDRDPSRFLFRRVIDRIKRPVFHLRIVLRQHLRDARRQRRLPVIDMPDRPHVHVRLRSLVFLFRHAFLLEPSEPRRLLSRLQLKRRVSVSVPQSGRRDSNPRPTAWKAVTLAPELLPLFLEPTTRIELVTSSLPRTRSTN